jgi:heat shock protein HslJ
MILRENAQSLYFRRPRSGSRVLIALSAALAAAVLASCQDASAPEPQAQGSEETLVDPSTFPKTRDVIDLAEEQGEAEMAHDFEGEADPDRITLGMKTWTWIKTEYNNDTAKEPVEKDAFNLTFSDGRVQGTTDCNSFNGAYKVDARTIHFDDKVAMTRMFCPDSQETEFVAMLLEVDSFFFTSPGRLILEIKLDSGTMQFR